MILRSMQHHDTAVSDTSEKKPDIILYYNKTKRAVDKFDQMVGEYTTKRQTRRWPLAVFFNMVDASALNAYIVFTSQNPDFANKPNARRTFLTSLAQEMVKPHMQRQCKISARLPKSVTEAMKQLGVSKSENTATISGSSANLRKRCHICDRKKDRKTRLVCEKCNKHFCAVHQALICVACK